jgi:Zn-dependent protease with chaperone function
VGLVAAPFFDRRSVTRGILLAEGARWPRRLGWGYRAITFGHVVLSVDDLDETILAHELAHVRQYESWGPAFFLAYPLASMVAKLHGKNAYRDNHFEAAARATTGR